MTAEAWAKVVADLTAQGLPLRVTDPATLARVAAILASAERRAS